MKYLGRILRYARPYAKLASLSVVLTIASALIGLLVPWPLKLLIDNVLGGEPFPAPLGDLIQPLRDNNSLLLASVIAGGLLITIGDHAVHVVSSFVNTRFEQRLVLDFRSDLFAHAQRLSLAFHDQRRSGLLMYAINFEADAAGGLVMALQPLVQSGLTLVGMFWITYQIDAQLALLSLVVVPFLYYSVGYYATHIQARLTHVKGQEAESLSIIHEAMQMLRVIVTFGREMYEVRRFRDQGRRTVDARVRVTVQQTLFSLGVSTITAVGTALVLGFGALHVMSGELTVGQLLVVMAYIAAVYQPLEAISTTVGSLQDRFVALQMAFHVMDTAPEVRDAPGAFTLHRARGRITFDDVSFSYATRMDTLKHICFEARPGEVVAIVGPTGAGKSTLASLIPRLYDPTDGRILLDGTDLRMLSVESVRSQVAVVLQEPLLFSGTIANNIRYGRLDASFDEVMTAAKAANAHDFIMALPDGYDTELGERGAKLSGGERQRISIARAFLKDAPILILDEPTSAIDSKTEAVILDALDQLMVGRTTLMIAHRLSTIRHADQILVLNRGELVERGTHDELLAQGGLYHQLYDLQTRSAQRRLRQADPRGSRLTDGSAAGERSA